MKAEQENKLFKAIRKAKDAIYIGYQNIEASLMKRDEQNEEIKKHYNDYSKEKMNDLYIEITRVFNEETKEAYDQVKAIVAEQKEAFYQVVESFYRADGKQIDPDDKNLFTGLIRLQKEEISYLVMKYIDNATMLRVIMNYCGVETLVDTTGAVKNKADDLPAEIIDIFRKVIHNGSKEKKIFDRFIHFACMGFAHPDENYTRFQSALDEYEEEAIADLKKARFIPVEDED